MISSFLVNRSQMAEITHLVIEKQLHLAPNTIRFNEEYLKDLYWDSILSYWSQMPFLSKAKQNAYVCR